MPEAQGRGTHRARRRVSGNWILESWNCFTLTRLVMAAGTVAVLMICRQGARTRCRDAISCKRRVVSGMAGHGDAVISGTAAQSSQRSVHGHCCRPQYLIWELC